MGIRDSRRKRVYDSVTPMLSSGEEIVAVVGMLEPNASSSVNIGGQRAMAVTSTKVILLKYAPLQESVARPEIDYPRSAVRVTKFRRANFLLSGVLRLDTPDGLHTFGVPGLHAAEAVKVVEALGGPSD